MNIVAIHPELIVGYTRAVTVTTDNPLKIAGFRQMLGAHWPFLADPGRKIQIDLDIQEYTDPINNPMIPHVFVLEPGLGHFRARASRSVETRRARPLSSSWRIRERHFEEKRIKPVERPSSD